jgi:hypothetical protein
MIVYGRKDVERRLEVVENGGRRRLGSRSYIRPRAFDKQNVRVLMSCMTAAWSVNDECVYVN